MGELPEGLGAFDAGDLSFVVDDGLSLVPSATNEVDEQRLDLQLAGAPSPLASWILARLTALAQGSLAIDPETVEECEGALYVIDFVVRQNGAAVGKVQLQAGNEGAALLGVVTIEPQLVVERFVTALRAEPNRVEACRVRVRDPSWPEEQSVEYGYDGSRYL